MAISRKLVKGIKNQLETDRNFPIVKHIICKHCEQLLWKVTIKGMSRSGPIRKVQSFKGVMDYDDAWGEGKRLIMEFCPFCEHQWCDVVVGNGGKFCVPTLLEDKYGQ